MKERYESPELEITEYETEDIITLSVKLDNDISNDRFKPSAKTASVWNSL